MAKRSGLAGKGVGALKQQGKKVKKPSAPVVTASGRKILTASSSSKQALPRYHSGKGKMRKQ